MDHGHAGVSCPVATTGLSGVAVAAGHVFFSALGGKGAFESTVDSAACDRLIDLPVVGPAPPRVFAFDASRVWLSSSDRLGRNFQNGASALGPVGDPVDLWGYEDGPFAESVFACTPTGVHRVRFDGSSFVLSDVVTTPCRSVAGIAHCDGTADVWMLSAADGTLHGMRVGPSTDLATLPVSVVTLPTGASPVALSVDAGAIWLAGTGGVYRSPRPTLP